MKIKLDENLPTVLVRLLTAPGARYGYDPTGRMGNLLLAHGFSYATDELLALRVPFVLDHDYDSIPQDDPRWEDDEFEPPLAPVSLHECMFGD